MVAMVREARLQCRVLRTIFLFAAVVSTVLCCGTAGAQSRLDKPALESYIRYLLLWGPEIRVEISDPRPSALEGFDEVTVGGYLGSAGQKEVFFVSKDGKRMIRGSLLDLTKNPFDATRSKLRIAGQPAFGPEDAPVVVAIFSDFECQFCKQEASVVRTTLAQKYPSQVRVVFKDFPLAVRHPWSTLAAISGRCIFRQKPEAFWLFHDWVFEHQSEITVENLKTKVMEAVQDKGLNQAELDTCIATKATAEEINSSIQEGIELGVTGTPVLFVNGRMMPGPAWQNLRGAIEAELSKAKAKTP